MLFHYVMRSLVARLRTNVVTMLSVALFVTGSTIGLAVYRCLDQQLVQTAPPENILVMARGAASERGSRLSLETANKLVLLDGIARDGATPLVVREVVTEVYVNTDFSRYEPAVGMRGMDAMSMRVHQARIITGAPPAAGTLEVMLGRAVAARHPEMKVGGELYLPGGPARISGVFSARGTPMENEIWTHKSALELHVKVKFMSSVTLVANPGGVDALVARINADRDLQAQAVSVASFRAKSAGLATILRVVVILLVLLSVVATSTIAATMAAAIATRIPELAAMAAIGIRRSVLARMVIVESVLLAAIGALIGVGASELVRSQIGALPFGDAPVELAPTLVIPMVGLGLGIIVGVIGGLAPAIAVRRLDIISGLR